LMPNAHRWTGRRLAQDQIGGGAVESAPGSRAIERDARPRP
jgi:hypothetical protein